MNVLIRYHEIALKGKNRPFFVAKLAHNCRRATADLGPTVVRVLAGRLALEAPEGVSWEALRLRLESVFGIANFSRSEQVGLDLEALKAAVVSALQGREFASFRVTTKRAYKAVPWNSGDVDRAVGAAVQLAYGTRVDLSDPELTIFVEVLKDRIHYSMERFRGPGGFPVGSSGKVLALLSGGIDSPVAAQRLMRRGCTVVLAHFHAYPLQDHTTIDKVRDLARILTRFQFKTRLLLVPFGPIQQVIVASCPAPLRVVLYRRFMMRIGEALARKTHAKALVTGESLGQVASQTLDNLSVIDEASRGLVLRPLVGMDKDEITAEARRIGTFTVSTIPDQDCCQLFVPRSPATAATLEGVRRAEAALDVPALVSSALAGTEDERFAFPPAPEGVSKGGAIIHAIREA